MFKKFTIKYVYKVHSMNAILDSRLPTFLIRGNIYNIRKHIKIKTVTGRERNEVFYSMCKLPDFNLVKFVTLKTLLLFDIRFRLLMGVVCQFNNF